MPSKEFSSFAGTMTSPNNQGGQSM